MRNFGIIAAVLALSIGTWFFMKKTSPVQDAPTQTSESAKPESPAPDELAHSEAAPVAPTAPSAPVSAEPGEASSAPAAGVSSTDAANNVTGVDEAKSENPSLNTPSASKAAVTAKVGTPPARVKSEAPKPEPAKNCFTYEYRHHESAKSKDIESFLDFSNAFPIAAENVNKKSICVKVNQKPVDFQVLKLKGKEEIVIGPVVGPESLIRISYCTGQAQCREACVPQKKRFMDDLLSDAHADDFQDSWGSAGADANSKELKAKSKELQALAKTNGALNDRAMMRDWNTLQKQEWTCNQK